MAYTHQTLEELAPDQASLAAARGLLAPKKWPLLAAEGELLWALYQGSGSTPYRAAFDGEDRGYTCSCPSRKFPCKHVLALAWLALDRRDLFTADTRPDWVDEWLARRRRRPGVSPQGATTSPSAEDGAGQRPSLDAAVAGPPPAETVDPAAAARAARARERNRERREEDTLRALDELDTWLGDQFARGLAAAVPALAEGARAIARRLADAKAGALATRLEGLPSRVGAAASGEREEALLAALGELHLVAETYRRAARLPAGLVADARHAVGWTSSREALQQDPATLRVRATFDVAATRDELQPDKLRRLETWLVARDADSAPRCALLVDYVPAATRGYAGLGVGDGVTGTLLFHSSAAPLRAVFDADGGAPCSGMPLPAAGRGLAAALDELDDVRVRLPWAGARPLHADGCLVRRASDGRFWLTDADGGAGLPIAREREPELFPLLGLAPFTAFGVAEDHEVDLRASRTELGSWGAR